MEDDLFSKESCYGIADEDLKKIRIQKVGIAQRIGEEEGSDPIQVEITDAAVVETFYHELCHIILDALGEDQLSQNERLINMLGKSFLEVYLSSNYEEEKVE